MDIRTAGLLLTAAAIAASIPVACTKGNESKPAMTTVIKRQDGTCIGYDKCPPVDDQHITAVLEPKSVTTSVEVPTVSMSPTVTEVPTMVPSSTSVMVPTVSPTS